MIIFTTKDLETLSDLILNKEVKEKEMILLDKIYNHLKSNVNERH